MKKYKSLLWFVIPIFAPLIFILAFLFRPGEDFSPPMFISNSSYSQILMNDSFFKNALLNTAVIYILLLSVFFVIMFVMLRIIMKKNANSRKSVLFYVISLSVIFIACLGFHFGTSVLFGSLSASFGIGVTGRVPMSTYLLELFSPLSMAVSLFIAFLVGLIVRFIDIKISTKKQPQAIL